MSNHRLLSVPLTFALFFALSLVVDELFNTIAWGTPDSLAEHVVDGLFMTGLVYLFLSAETGSAATTDSAPSDRPAP
jgi:hypothetical protein